MEVKPDTGINIGSNPFYRPSNSSYGSTWMASGGKNPLKQEDVISFHKWQQRQPKFGSFHPHGIEICTYADNYLCQKQGTRRQQFSSNAASFCSFFLNGG